ncbi:hypothetical protein P3T35_002894 [Kitasatospora sp. GP30]|uniref:hypothetical protein n=1 Tax=Kitasatospora sp. GP30 TaxID=3035084 RepID=UPI000CB133B9|nr:hypothetical protein [Kitasatospora sp. GP30]MDH6140884.1 hypothetical protein [Kitasatospora sp. GP30]
MAALLRAVAAAAAAVALFGTLAACEPTAGPKAAASGRRSAAAEPALPVPPAPRPADRSPLGVLLSAEQVLQTAGRARLHYWSEIPGGATDCADGVLSWAPPAMQLTRTAPGATGRLIVLGGVSYQGGDTATAARLGGRHWERSTGPDGPGGQPQTPYAELADQLDPLQAVTAAAAAGDLRLVGEELLGKVPVGHWAATTTVADYTAAEAELLSPARRDRLAAALGGGGVTALTLDLWLNDRDQLVQLRRTGSSPQGVLDQLIEYRDYGDQLAVLAPPESDTRAAGQ